MHPLQEVLVQKSDIIKKYLKMLLVAGLGMIIAYLLFFRTKPSLSTKPVGIPVFDDIPDDIWKLAIETIKTRGN